VSRNGARLTILVSECVILIGLPGAGKTTFYQQNFAATHRHVSKDLWPNATGRDRRQRRALTEALTEGVPVVVDNTNPTVAERAAIIAAARAHGARIVGYFFDVTTREAVARNAARTGRQKVPNVAIFTVAKRLEAPTLAEGFDQLFRIRLTPERTFSVTPIEP
jgi:predicted kinase